MVAHEVKVRRIYEEPLDTDGYRILVDRLWPRGLSKEKAHLDEWCRAIAPSDELRRWYGHDPGLVEEFNRRYQSELRAPEAADVLERLRVLAEHRPLTLLTAIREPAISEAAVLCTLIKEDREP